MLPLMTPLRTLLDIKLGGLDDFVHSRRGAGTSWRVISNDIRDQTGIDITYETLRAWYGTDKKASA